MDQAIHKSRGQTVVTEYRVPLRKLQIGRNNQAFALIAIGNHLKEKLSRVLVERNKTDLINYDQLHLF